MRKKYPLYICIFCFLILNIFLIYNNIKNNYNQKHYFRLHVVANSNSLDDQIIKLNVVKKINSYLDSISKEVYAESKDKTRLIITDNINHLLKTTNSELKVQNAEYSCYANIGKISYDEKKSDSIDMANGIYDSVQIVLGEGKGENFWSLIFPYSYDPNYNINNDNPLSNKNIKIKSGILDTITKVVKNLKS